MSDALAHSVELARAQAGLKLIRAAQDSNYSSTDAYLHHTQPDFHFDSHNNEFTRANALGLTMNQYAVYLNERAQNKPVSESLASARAIDENRDEQASKAIQQYTSEFGPSVTSDLITDFTDQQLKTIDTKYDVVLPENKSSPM